MTNCTGFLNFKNNHTYQGPFLNGKKHGKVSIHGLMEILLWVNFDNGIYTQGIYKWGIVVISIGTLNPSSKIQEKYTINMAWVFLKIKMKYTSEIFLKIITME